MTRALAWAACILLLIACGESYRLLDDDQPVAEAGPVQKVLVGSTVSLDGSASTGDDLQYHWTIRSAPNDEAERIARFESQQTRFVADHVGTYVVQLHVQNQAGQGSRDFVTIEAVENQNVIPDVVDHTGLTRACITCHNGVDAHTRPPGHIASTSNCATCHSTLAWVPVAFVDHNEVLGNCTDCHDGQTAPGKPDTHITTALECNACHHPGLTFSNGLLTPLDEPGSAIRAQGRIDGAGSLADTGSAVAVAVFDHSTIGDALCIDCHNGVLAAGKTASHIPAPNNCDVCHSTTAWSPARTAPFPPPDAPPGSDLPVPPVPPATPPPGTSVGFDHSGLGAGIICVTCHDAVLASGKSVSHIATTDRCENCHSTLVWVPVIMVDHNEVLGTCTACHTSPPGHIPVNSECNLCHNTVAWLPVGGAPLLPPGVPPVRPPASPPVNPPGETPPGTAPPPTGFDHSTLGPGVACASCHNGVLASGKSASHIISTEICDACHTTVAWVPVSFVNHVEVIGPCDSCHNGVVAQGKPASHINSGNHCEACHSTERWGPVVTVDHLQTIGICSSCHNNVIARGKSQSHVPTDAECDVCHTTTSWL